MQVGILGGEQRIVEGGQVVLLVDLCCLVAVLGVAVVLPGLIQGVVCRIHLQDIALPDRVRLCIQLSSLCLIILLQRVLGTRHCVLCIDDGLVGGVHLLHGREGCGGEVLIVEIHLIVVVVLGGQELLVGRRHLVLGALQVGVQVVLDVAL